MLKYHIHIHNFTSQYTCPPAPQHTLLHTYLPSGRETGEGGFVFCEAVVSDHHH